MTRAIPPLSDAQRAALVERARSYIDVRWQHQGRSEHGLDCAGLVVLALRDLGFTPSDSIGYPRRPYRHMLEKTIRRNLGLPLPANTPLRTGDVVLMKFDKDEPHHVGIIGEHKGYLTLIHAHAPDKKVCEMRLDKVWRDRIVEVYR